jgi:N-acyl-D-aspartate/D-glutamate deacylase
MHDLRRRTVIVGARVVDGSGQPGVYRDVFIDGGRIERVDPPSETHPGWDVLDATRRVVSPGFIDVHSHADNAPFLDGPDTTKILQGVTTEVVGNCGLSLAPRVERTADILAEYTGRLLPRVDWHGYSMRDFFEETDRRGYCANYAPLVGHGTLRTAVMGLAARAPSDAELAEMGDLLEESLDSGCFGLSTGLIYPPGMFADTEELIALARRLRSGTLYATHMRNEGAAVVSSVQEAICIGENAGVPIQISHHKAAGRQNWGKTHQTLTLIREARARGVRVSQDMYPYTASSTLLTALLPPSFQDLSEAELCSRLKQEETILALERALASEDATWENFVAGCGWEGILIASTASHAWEGQTIADIANQLKMPPVRALVQVLLSERLRATMIVFSMAEDDLVTVLRDERTMIGSDGLPPGLGGKPHPRLFGTFPQVIARFVREVPVLSLEEAVHKMTWLPAQTFSIPERGLVAPGYVADLVAFDPECVRPVGDYRDPVHPPDGIDWVMQSGEIVVRSTSYVAPRRGVRLQPSQ